MLENTLTVGRISEGFVLDHIEAGKSMEIYKYLHLDKLDCCVAIIKNAKSNKMGKKDIIKIEGPLCVDLDILGVLDDNITINMIENDHSAARGKMAVRELIVFKHSKELGDCPAYKLFDAVEVKKKDDVEYPRKYQDYTVQIHENEIPDSVEVKRMI